MDRTPELTIAALIFLAGTAGLVSGEDVGGAETTTDSEDDADCREAPRNTTTDEGAGSYNWDRATGIYIDSDDDFDQIDRACLDTEPEDFGFENR